MRLVRRRDVVQHLLPRIGINQFAMHCSRPQFPTLRTSLLMIRSKVWLGNDVRCRSSCRVLR
jgi:hypothetical protein